jgi:hypothetical protein
MKLTTLQRHAVFVSQPKLVAELIEQAATATAK